MTLQRDSGFLATILILEDEENARNILQAFLPTEQYRLIFAFNGAEGLEILEQYAESVQPYPDLIISDIMMPLVDGIAFCKQVKTHEEWCHIPLVMVSVLEDSVQIASALDAGADDYLTKPINRTELLARIRTMLRLRRQHQSLTQNLALKDNLLEMIARDFDQPINTLGRALTDIDEQTEIPPAAKVSMNAAQNVLASLKLSILDLKTLLSADR